MNYIIHTPSAARLKTEILDRVSEKAAVEREQSKDVLSYCRAEAGSALAKVDANGKGIVTWQVAETDSGEKVLVHTADQWAEKGCIILKQVPGRNELQVRFHYWDSWEERNNEDDKIMLGRFTELLLVHFSYFVDKIVIE